MSQKQKYTPDGFKDLQNELHHLKTVRREEIKEQIAVARSFGDLSENAEYEEARNEQTKCETRIKELEDLIENAIVIDESKVDNGVVSLGSTVDVYDVECEEEIQYIIVGSNEANPMENKISDQSPIGRALMDARAGETISVEVPNGVIHFKVLNVTRVRNHEG